jgi:hypothetical protein
MRALLRALAFTITVFSCSSSSQRSADEVRAEFEAFVEDNNSCAADDECVIVTADCPVGCYVVVNETRAEATEAKARELVEEYESGGRDCDYGCAAPGTPRCDDGRCTEQPASGGGPCTLIGCGSAFSARFEKAGTWSPGDYRVVVELDGTVVECTATLPLSCDAPFPCDNPDVLLLLDGCALPAAEHALGGVELVTSTPTSVSVEVFYDGASLARGDWQPAYVTSRPNGPDCEPECRTAPPETLSVP